MVVSDFEENLDKSSFKDPREYAIANACGKAREVTSSLKRAAMEVALSSGSASPPPPPTFPTQLEAFCGLASWIVGCCSIFAASFALAACKVEDRSLQSCRTHS